MNPPKKTSCEKCGFTPANERHLCDPAFGRMVATHSLPQEKESVFVGGARIGGKTSLMLMDFVMHGKAGQSAIYSTPQGNFYSPKAMENALSQARREYMTSLADKVRGMKGGYRTPVENVTLDEVAQMIEIEKELEK